MQKIPIILLADLIGKVDDVIASDQAEQDKIEGDIAKIEKRLTQVNVDLGKAEEVERTEVALQEVSSALGEKKERLQLLLAEYEAEQKREPEQSALRQQIALAENELPRYDELDQVRKELDARRDALKAALDQREEQKNLQDKCALLLNDAKEKLEAVKDAGREEAVLEGRLQQAESRAERRRSLGRRIERVGKPFEAIGRGAAEVSGRCSKGGETAAEVSADEQGIPR